MANRRAGKRAVGRRNIAVGVEELRDEMNQETTGVPVDCRQGL
jgi:hypothetical protein